MITYVNHCMLILFGFHNFLTGSPFSQRKSNKIRYRNMETIFLILIYFSFSYFSLFLSLFLFFFFFFFSLFDPLLYFFHKLKIPGSFPHPLYWMQACIVGPWPFSVSREAWNLSTLWIPLKISFFLNWASSLPCHWSLFVFRKFEL